MMNKPSGDKLPDAAMTQQTHTHPSSTFQQLLTPEARIAPDPELVAKLTVQDYQTVYAEAEHNLEDFWNARAREFHWVTPWTHVLEGQAPHARWFTGGQLNITTNCLDRHVEGTRAEKTALIWVGEDGSERSYTFRELLQLTCQIANGLQSLGLKKGDRVCIYLPLTPEGIATMLACARIGAIHSVVYAGLGSSALRTRIEDAQARVIVTADVGYRRGKTTNLKAIVDEAIADLPLVENVIVYHRTATHSTTASTREIDFYDLCRSQATSCQPAIMEAEDPLFLLYTSGSTGKPKGCMYVHGGFMVGTAYYIKLAFDIQEDDIYWCMSDIGWIVGHTAMVYGPWANGTTVLAREGAPDYPNAGIVWGTIEKYGVTKLFTAPTSLRMFMKFGPRYPQAHDLASLRVIICAGEPLNPEAYLWAREHIGHGKVLICDNWWQTETAAPTIGTLPCMEARPGRSGKPFPGYTVRVLDRQGQPTAPLQGGLLTIDGSWPQMFRTIWGDKERYLDYWRTLPPYYVAGDVATVDEDGYIAVIGRFDDVLNVAGHRIGTADIESALVSHPMVAEAAAIGKPDPIKGEAIKAFVTLKFGYSANEKLKSELIEHVRHELGPIATPSELEFTASLPKTRSGKIMRRVLKARELGSEPGDLTTIEE
ncbi:MAG TPA: acetate--CoA ligase [Dictyobacter sp.]|jgi:acetyl-CoA synthetase|nr:acetate--CoA ligase [Dictyobacter sp.]